MNNNKFKILIVEDNQDMVFLLNELIGNQFEISSATTLEDATKRFIEENFDATILDLNLPDSTGIDTLKTFVKKFPESPIIVFTGIDNKSVIIESIKEGAQDYLIKDKITEDILLRSIRHSIERKRTENKLKANEERYRQLFNRNRDAVFLADLDTGIIIDTNPQAEKLLKKNKKEIIGIHHTMLHPSDQRLKAMYSFTKFINGDKEKLSPTYIDILTSDNLRVPVEIVGSIIDISENKKRRQIVQGIFRDITDREQAKEKIKENEEKYRTMVENTQDGIFIISDYEIQFVNEAFAKMLDYDVKEIIGKNFTKFVAPEDLATVTGRYRLRQAGEDVPKGYEFRLLHKDGKTRTIVDMKVSIITYNNKIASMGTVKDITERRLYEEKLKESEERYRAIVQFSNEMIWSIDKDGYFTFINRSVEKVLGYKSEELIGQNIVKLIPNEDISEMKDKFSRMLLGNNTMGYETPFISKGNQKRIISINSVPLYSRGNIVGTTSFGRDITEQKMAEKQIRESAIKLARSNKELEQFAYIASHDLQEPLRSIYSFTQLLAEKLAGELDPETREYIGFILEGTNRMREMVNDLLMLSRINTRRKPFENVNISEVLTQVMLNLHDMVIKNKARITIGDMPTICGDRNQLTQLFQNLIDNAIKFRKIDDRIVPHVEITASLNEIENKWIFSVKDNGIGIDPKNFQKLFVIFQRLHNRDEYPGTGIGLALCKKIIEHHEGEIWVDSKLGVGSNFQFSIPDKEICRDTNN